MITYDDACSVATRLLMDYADLSREDAAALASTEMEQKKWLRGEIHGTQAEQLSYLLNCIDPSEIAHAIAHDRLKKWCTGLKVDLQMTLRSIVEGNDEDETN